MNNANLIDASFLRFAYLQVLDLKQNPVDLNSLFQMVTQNPKLEDLSVSAEIIQPDTYHRLLICGPVLKNFNTRPVSSMDRFEAIAKFGNPNQKAALDFHYWDAVFTAVPEVMGMESWTPDVLTELILPDCNLKEFHVGRLSALRVFIC